MSRNQYNRSLLHSTPPPPNTQVIKWAKVAVNLFHVNLLISLYGGSVFFCLWWVCAPSWGLGYFHGEVNRSVWLWLCGSIQHVRRRSVRIGARESCMWIHTPGLEPARFGEVLLIKPSFLRSCSVFQLHSHHVQLPTTAWLSLWLWSGRLIRRGSKRPTTQICSKCLTPPHFSLILSHTSSHVCWTMLTLNYCFMHENLDCIHPHS